MAKPSCSDNDFERMFVEHGAAETARKLGTTQRNVYGRRERLEKRLGRQITREEVRQTRHGVAHPGRIELSVPDGIVLVGSDAHIWPGPYSTALRAFIQFCKDLKPRVVVMNGDVMDCATISRHPPIGWENRPTVQQEIEAAQDALHDIEKACGKARKCWALGNHDGRYETRLATAAPEFAKVQGVHLKDSFPQWEPCWSVWINGDAVIKHRHKGGIGAVRNSTLTAGLTMITGHLHSLKVTPLTDYRGTRFGVDTGCLADPSHKAFVDYTEDNPLDWRSGFVVLTFKNGRMLWPEIVSVHDAETIDFRGQLMRV